MEVLKSNFLETLSIFTSLLEKTDIIAFDLEMAGINGERGYGTDMPFEFYNKNFGAANKYQIIQIGLCLFERTDSELSIKQPKYNAYPFSFYVFPRTVNGKMDKDLTMELGSVEFNANSGGVDWNKWINQGVSYFDKNDLKSAENMFLKEKYEVKKDYSYHLYPDQTEEYQKMLTKLKEWYELKDNQLETLEDAFDLEKSEDLLKNNQMFEIDSRFFNVVIKMKQYVLKHFENVSCKTFKVKDKKFKVVRVFKVKPEQKSTMNNLYKDYLLRDFKEIKGFSQIWENLKKYVKSRKIPMIGHNSTGDILFLMSHLENKLTADYVKFKRNVKEVFQGGFYDTKNVSRHLNQDANRLSLGGLFELLTSKHKSNVTLPEEFKFQKGVFHNAGYDAYITGVSFIIMSNLISESKVNLEKFKVKMYRIHDYMIDFENEEIDQFNTKVKWALVLNKKYVKALKEESLSGSMDSLISDFSKMYVEKKKKKEYKSNAFPDYDMNVFFAFADSVEKMVKKSFKKNEVRVFDNPHLKSFGDNYMIIVSIKPGLVDKFRKLIGDGAELMSLSDAYKMFFELYNKIYRKE
jgi:hypothetical protein